MTRQAEAQLYRSNAVHAIGHHALRTSSTPSANFPRWRTSRGTNMITLRFTIAGVSL